jgi:hypothetical protein
MLSDLPAAQQLISEQVLQRLIAGVQQVGSQGFHKLCQLPAAQQLSAEQVHQLISEALQQGYVNCAEELCELVAVRQFDRQQVVQLLAAAVQQGSYTCTKRLCSLQAAQHLSCEQVMQLLAAAVQHGSYTCTRQICSLPAAQQLSSGQMKQLLAGAVQHCSGVCSAALFTISTAIQQRVCGKTAAGSCGGWRAAHEICSINARSNSPLKHSSVASGWLSWHMMNFVCRCCIARKGCHVSLCASRPTACRDGCLPLVARFSQQHMCQCHDRHVIGNNTATCNTQAVEGLGKNHDDQLGGGKEEACWLLKAHCAVKSIMLSDLLQTSWGPQD